MALQNRLYLPGQLLVVGIGVVLSSPVSCDAAGLMFRFRNTSTIGFGVVLTGNPSLRFEPEIGFSFNDFKLDQGSGEYTTSATSFETGLGVLYILPHQGPFSVYLGPRGGYSRRDSSSESIPTSGGPGAVEVDTNSWFASGALGAEVRVTSSASIGVEGAVVYENLSGTVKQATVTPASERDFSSSDTSTAFSIVLRWFPWDSQ